MAVSRDRQCADERVWVQRGGTNMGRIAVYILLSTITGIVMMCITGRYYTRRFDKPLKAGIVWKLCMLAVPAAFGTFAGVYGYDVGLFLDGMLLASVSMAAAMIDRLERIIPNVSVLAMVMIHGCIEVCMLLTDRDRGIYEICMGVAGCLLMAILLAGVRLVFKGGIGMGDVKMLLAFGWCLGALRSLYALLAAAVAALVMSGVKIILGHMKHRESFGFGPYLAFGLALVLVTT